MGGTNQNGILKGDQRFCSPFIGTDEMGEMGERI
jgi:hypothetical protein